MDYLRYYEDIWAVESLFVSILHNYKSLLSLIIS